MKACGIISSAFLLTLPILAASSALTLENNFGRVELNTDNVSIEKLYLRKPDGQLETQSLLSPSGSPWLRGAPEWGTQAYTYVVSEDGRRFESRTSKAKITKQSEDRIHLSDILLADSSGHQIATEEWIFTANNSTLDWTVKRTWLADTQVRVTGQPALFFTHRPDRPEINGVVENSVTTTIWYDPLRIDGGFDPLYKWIHPQSIVSRHPLQVLDSTDTWAVFKLWTNWHHSSDLILGNQSGRLYRRGMFGWVGEAGVQPELDEAYARTAGTKDETTLRIGRRDKYATGIQLKTEIPDSLVNQTLRSFYGSLFNGGTVNDQKTYDMGNESDGWYYAGSSAWQSFSLLAGVNADTALSAHSIQASDALRRKLTHILRTLEEDGRTRFGYNLGANFIDDNLNTIIACYNYYLATGDRSFIRRHLDDFALMLNYFLERRNADGLFDFGGRGHWYYDVMPSSGVSTNHNTLLYAAMLRMSRMCKQFDQGARATFYENEANSLKASINRVLWTPDAPGGPRFADWITPEGRRVTYAADIAQFPTIVYDAATPEHARQLIATIDKRIIELERDFGYAGYASVSAYWPVPDDLNPLEWQKPYTVYMNGGTFLAMTFYEIIARSKAGDLDGAWERLKRFSEGAAAHSWVGNNWFDLKGQMIGGQDEPYLSDMVAVPSSLIHGILGINFQLDAAPSASGKLPSSWQKAKANVISHGQEYQLNWRDNTVEVEAIGKPTTAPAIWEIDTDFDTYTLARDSVLQGDAHAGMAISLKAGLKAEPKGNSEPALISYWGLDETAGDYANTLSSSIPLATVGGEPVRAVPAAGADKAAIQIRGDVHLETAVSDQYSNLPFGGIETLVRFRTNSSQTGVLVSRNGAFCLYLKEGKLAGWVMNAAVHAYEVVSDADVLDGAWHVASLAYDPADQSLSIYLNGALAAGPIQVDQTAAPNVPAQIAVGGLGPSYRFMGEIDEVALFDAPLPDGKRQNAYKSGFDLSVKPTKKLADTDQSATTLSGTWQSPSCDWVVSFKGQTLETRTVLRDGSIELVLELSDDNFRTLKAEERINLSDSYQKHTIEHLPAARYSRIRVELSGSAAPEGPSFHGFRLTGEEKATKSATLN